MTHRHPTRLLWLALVLCAPLPFFLVETGREPLAALLAMLGVTLRLIASEGSGGAIALVAWILAAQVVVGAVVLAVAVRIVGFTLTRLLGSRADAVLVALAAAIVVVAATQPVYRTPFRPGGLHANLFEVFE